MKTTNTEVLASLEEQRINEAKGDERVFRQVLKGVTTDHDLTKWTFTFISGKTLEIEVEKTPPKA